MEDVNQQITPSQTPQTPDHMHSSFENSSNSKVIPIIIVVVLLVLVGVGSYVLGTKKSQPTTENKIVSQLSPIPVNETANWKTYASDKGYSIRYPDSLKQSASTTYDGIGGVVTQDSWSPGENTYSIYIDSYADGVDTKLEFTAKTQSDENILIAGQNVKKLIGIERISDTGTLIWVGPVKNKGQNYMLIFSSGSKRANSEDLQTFDQMFSTFKFSE